MGQIPGVVGVCPAIGKPFDIPHGVWVLEIIMGCGNNNHTKLAETPEKFVCKSRPQG